MLTRLFSFFSFLLISISPAIALSASFYSILGSSRSVNWIIRIEVLDSETHVPIRNANITLSEEPSQRNILTLETDEAGVGIILVKEVRYIPGVGKLKVIAPGFRYWEKEIQQWDFVQNEKDRMLYLTDKNPWNWTDLNNVPSDSEIIREIKNRHFKIWDDPDSLYIGPGIFEFNVIMEKVRKKIDIN
jgi:hypothetical protein